ncbi:MAG: helix-turn-helix transcriptional regulator [Dehalococcoidia bacterium]
MDTTPGIQHLSDRERDILALIAKGRTNAEIGEAVGLRFDTVKWYVSEILSKLGVDSREQAADAWRSYRRPQAMVGRRMRALIGLPLAKVGVGVTGAAVTGGLAVAAGGFALAAIGGVTDDADSPVDAAIPADSAISVDLDLLARLTPTVEPYTAPISPQERLAQVRHLSPDVDIISASFQGRTFTIGMYEAPVGLCNYTYESTNGTRAEIGRTGCVGPVTEPHLLSHMGTGSPSTFAGMAHEEVVRVRIKLAGGSQIELDTVPAPAELDVPWRFWITALEPGRFVSVEGLDAAGNIVESRGPLAPLAD